MSDLKIFIVGPVGAGKTVFASMLNRYVTTHPECGVHFKTADWKTRAYFAKIDEALSCEPWWPVGTAPGELIELQWEWEVNGRLAKFDLVDPPGEDIERELRGEASNLQILEKIRTADLVFVLMDLYGHQGDSHLKRTQNAWIVENVLRHASPDRSLVVGVSKGDVLRDSLPAESWTDKERLLALISEKMPEFTMNAYRQQLSSSKVQLAMFSAISTESYLDAAGHLRQRPKQPFESQGLEVFVKTITEAHDDKVWNGYVSEALRILKKLVTSRIFLAMVAVLTAFLWWMTAWQTFQITFITSSRSSAGTDASVYLYLIGDKRESFRINFPGRSPSKTHRDAFEIGATDVFEVEVWRVGTVREVVVGHDDSGTDAAGRRTGGWHLASVEVEEKIQDSWGPKTTFPCDLWLDQTEGNGLEVRLSKSN